VSEDNGMDLDQTMLCIDHCCIFAFPVLCGVQWRALAAIIARY